MTRTRRRGGTSRRQNGTAVKHARFAAAPEPRNGERHRASEAEASAITGRVPGKEKR